MPLKDDLHDLQLSDIIDGREMQGLFEKFHDVTPVPMFLIDTEGRILASVGWSDVCTQYHRAHPETCRKCVESDTESSAGIPEGEYKIYKCKNNMWSAATPIMVGGKLLGNLFSGQFFFTDEEPDLELFRAQAERYGFPEKEYLSALGRAPRLSRAFVTGAMQFYLKLAQNIAHAGWNNLRLKRTAQVLRSSEEEHRRLNRMLTARSRSNQAMVRATGEQEFLTEVCTLVVEGCGHAMVWIGWAEQDEEKTVRPAAFAGCRKEDLETLSTTWADTERGRGPAGRAIRSGRPSVCRDLLSDSSMRPWREEALRLGYASSAVLPLLSGGRAFGVIAIYSRKADSFPDEELALLSGLADDLAYGIGVLRLGQARKQAEARFQQAQKMEAVGLLAGGIAHDFNNILAAIVGYNGLLLDGLRGNPLRRYSREIQRSSEMAATLTQQLLGVSGNRGAQRHALDPNSVILAMAKMLRRLVGEKIRLELKLHHGVWPLKMDSGQLEQIVLNLAVNARDAMPQGGTLVLSTKNVLARKPCDPKATNAPAPGRCVVVEIRDSGLGMDADVRARIFEPFFTTKGPGRGTGLGLPTVKSIVEEYEGCIAVESVPGHGSVFRICLPSRGAAPRRMAPRGKHRARRGGDETILVVEDNSSLAASLKITLERAGYAVFCASTAEEAVLRFGKLKRSISLLLTDVVLPDMDGPALVARLKTLRPGIKVVYMSGYPGNALGPIVGFGGGELLEKPFSPARLLQTLREVLDREQGDLF